MTEHPEWEAWLQEEIRWHGDRWYHEGVYTAYLAASRPPREHGDLWAEPDGGLRLATDRRREPLRLADEAQRLEFVRWLERRCGIGTTYPDMKAWEEWHHEAYLRELRSW